MGMAATLRPDPAAGLQKDAALERARREVRMLDDLYKTAVVLITDHYVEDISDTAAGEVASELFAAMKKNGWHEAHLVDATGKPINKANRPRDDFERKAIEKIKAGEKYYEEVEGTGDNRTLRAATIVPVVMKKCIICHPGFKEGDLLGAISYKLKVE
jgi:hypothetical protein